MNHVAEIQNAADGGACGIDQQVLAVAVAMDRLAAQRAQLRHALPEAQDGALGRAARGRRFDAGQILGELRQPAHVPGEALSQGRMKETLQRPVEPRQGLAQILRSGVPGGESASKRPARKCMRQVE